MLNPDTTLGSILVNVIAGLVLTAILAALACITGPLRWWIQNRHLHQLVANERKFIFTFNPLTSQRKFVTFCPNRQIGEGQNENEHTWKIRREKLEILASNEQIYSRFFHDKETGLLKHTNDPDTPSIHGQYFQPSLQRSQR